MLKPRFDPFRFSRPQRASQESRHRMITEAAYFRAKQREFAPGHEIEDWLAAEAQVDSELSFQYLRSYG